VKRSQLALLREHGVRPRKRRGQNFLVDANLARAIATEVVALGDEVLELGAGAGALTDPLLEAGARVVAVEIDADLVRVLRATLGDHPQLTILHDDLARLDWRRALAAAGERPIVAGNLPYVLTSCVLFALAGHRELLAGAVLLVQREVADRLTAAPGGRDYGVLAVVLGSFFAVAQVRRVPPAVFWPRPEVSSAVVKLTPRESWPAAERDRFTAVVKACFEQRRKKMATVLRNRFGLDEAAVRELGAALGFDPAQRPETLPRTTFRSLAQALPEDAAS
jgi:16S rRNA (adenine1518-N6/adenine1519-N6)-dimethyltransferase